MKRIKYMASMGLVSLVLSLNIADVQAGQELKVELKGPDFYCLFDPSCTVEITETMSTFTLPNTTGEGILYSRTFPASLGSPASGAHGYEFRIDLRNVEASPGLECIDSIRLKLGTPLATLDYDGDGVAGDQVFFGPFFDPDGAVNYTIYKAIKDGPYITFQFQPPSPVCPFGTHRNRTVYFGVVGPSPPIATPADMELAFAGGVIQAGARTPNLLPKLSFKFALLYDTIATLPPGGFIAPSLNAGEGHRRALLNRVNTALNHVEEGRVLPALQLLEGLLLLTDGDADDWVQDDPQTRENEQMHLYEILQELIETLQESRNP